MSVSGTHESLSDNNETPIRQEGHLEDVPEAGHSSGSKENSYSQTEILKNHDENESIVSTVKTSITTKAMPVETKGDQSRRTQSPIDVDAYVVLPAEGKEKRKQIVYLSDDEDSFKAKRTRRPTKRSKRGKHTKEFAASSYRNTGILSPTSDKADTKDSQDLTALDEEQDIKTDKMGEFILTIRKCCSRWLEQYELQRVEERKRETKLDERMEIFAELEETAEARESALIEQLEACQAERYTFQQGLDKCRKELNEKCVVITELTFALEEFRKISEQRHARQEPVSNP